MKLVTYKKGKICIDGVEQRVTISRNFIEVGCHAIDPDIAVTIGLLISK